MGLIRRVMVAVVFLAVACCPGPLRAQETSRISGAIVDPAGSTIPDAEVVLKLAGQQKDKTRADAFGSFVFSVQPGTYSLEVASRGFETLTIRDISISGGEVKVLPSIRLEVGSVGEGCTDDGPQLPVLTVVVIKSDRGEITGEIVNNRAVSIKGVTVTISLSNGDHSRIRTATDERGKFTVTDLRPGTYSLTASLPDYADFVVQAIVVKEGQRIRIWPPLPIEECPRGVTCKPVSKVRIPAICL